jgi:hypothetical protein
VLFSKIFPCSRSLNLLKKGFESPGKVLEFHLHQRVDTLDNLFIAAFYEIIRIVIRSLYFTLFLFGWTTPLFKICDHEMCWAKHRSAWWLPLRTMSLDKTSLFCSDRTIAREAMHPNSFCFRIIFATDFSRSACNTILSKRFPFRSPVLSLGHDKLTNSPLEWTCEYNQWRHTINLTAPWDGTN